jgi:hypothetical protein
MTTTQTTEAITIRRGSGYGARAYKVGGIVVTRKPGHAQQILVVVSATEKYFREDGLSFGVGDDRGYIYSAKCRQANAEEIAQVVAADHASAVAEWAKREREAIASEIMAAGEYPADGNDAVEGERLCDAQNIYGSGDWFVIGAEWTWYIRNNGMDGDNWSANNVQTCGAGARGWRVPTTEKLTARLQKLG